MWCDHGDLATLTGVRPGDTRSAFIAVAYGAAVRPSDFGFDCDGDDWRLVAHFGDVLVFARHGSEPKARDVLAVLESCTTA